MSASGYYNSPWPAEDAGPARLQAPLGGAGLGLRPGEKLASVSRSTLMSTMPVLGDPGEVYLLTHSALRAQLGLPTTSCVELVDAGSLQTRHRSPRLAGGKMWPGGMALHRDGSLYVVYGHWAHLLDRQCQPRASRQLPVNLPYNSFVVLECGLIVTKNLSDTVPARLSVLVPGTLDFAGGDIECPEPSIARLSAVGDTVYVVGVRSIFRYAWDAARGALVLDTEWRFDYIGASAQSYGWDVVLADGDAWFMDNGRHRYRTKMLGAGVARSANRLIRVSLTDATDVEIVEISGIAGGSITNPPLVDVTRRIVVGYDSANAVMRAWRYVPGGRGLEELWRKDGFGCASHMICYPQTGELVTNDFGRGGEHVVVLDIETGAERGRVRLGGETQGVVFPAVGFGRDLYWCSMRRFGRVFVA